MNQTFPPIPVPHQLRESAIAGDGFVQHMRARGWSVADVRPTSTDPEVIRQPWLVCPNGARYSDRAFYHLFGITRFRKLLRTALLRTPCTTPTFAALCPDASEPTHLPDVPSRPGIIAQRRHRVEQRETSLSRLRYWSYPRMVCRGMVPVN